jgi:hypothetical protein
MGQQAEPLQAIADAYVRLVLSVGLHDGDYVDAYYGPPEVKEEVRREGPALEAIADRARRALGQLSEINTSRWEEIEQLRHRYLSKQLQALAARVAMLQGATLSFDEEARALYDAEPPNFSEDHFKKLLVDLGAILSGTGSVSERYDRFKQEFIIPVAKLDHVFQTAIAECRRRTTRHIELAQGESFTVEYVTNKAWSGYNWYKGNSYSLIQVNTDLPIYIDRAIDLAAHEGYPGHHVYNSLLESRLYRERGWAEFSVYALFSPQSLIAEGTANFGIEVAFPGSERVAFERDILFMAAGMNPRNTELYYRVHTLFGRLAYAGNEAARQYLNGTMTREQAAEWLVTYALMAPERAQQRTRFFDAYRSYVINYNLGQDLVKAYIESRGGTPDQPERRWEEFKRLISSPRLPSGLQV